MTQLGSLRRAAVGRPRSLGDRCEDAMGVIRGLGRAIGGLLAGVFGLLAGLVRGLGSLLRRLF